MLYWAIVFLLISLVAGFMGFGRVSTAASGISKILFFVFLILAAITLILLMTGVALVA